MRLEGTLRGLVQERVRRQHSESDSALAGKTCEKARENVWGTWLHLIGNMSIERQSGNLDELESCTTTSTRERQDHARDQLRSEASIT